MTNAVLDVGDVVRTGVGLDVLEDTDTANVVSTGDEDGGTVVEFEDSINFVGDEVQLLKTKRARYYRFARCCSYIKYNLF